MKGYLDKFLNRDKYHDLDDLDDYMGEDYFGYLDNYTINDIVEPKSEIEIKNDLRKKKLESL